MLGLVRCAALPIEARATGEAISGAETVSRSLAAIIAAGYSQLMEADEEETLARLRSLPRSDRSEFDKGRTLEATRDGMLVEFANAVEPERIAAG
ncbi:MAG TPA: hypothetical protein VGL12_07195 [Roseiarcus sp.]